MISVHYQKRKNTELFQQFENPQLLFLSNPQNYIPIYKRFFSLNETNYNHINLNNKWFLSTIREKIEDDCAHIYACRLKNVETNKVKDRDVFFKLAPLLDPYKFMVGKYDLKNPTLFALPKLHSTTESCYPKYLDTNNAAYVDSFFLFLSSQLKHQHKVVHGVEYYGSYLGVKHDYRINVADDIDFLISSDYFNTHKNELFYIDNHDHLFQTEEHKPHLLIGDDISLKSCQSIDNNMFDDVFEDDTPMQPIDLNDLKDMSMEPIDVTPSHDQQVTLMSSCSTCSSRSSYTNDHDLSDEDNDCESEVFDSGSEHYSADSGDEDANYEDIDEYDDEEDEEPIYVTIPQFPVQVIAMECCGNTFDELILNSLSDDEYFSAFMQIIMTLLIYQKAFQFTHNDLHTNNVMYDTTDKKYLYYCYKNTYYKVPTFGRIFKIIDFGRSIYKFDGKIFCSDSFQAGGDAATQYNTEPYFNDKKPRLEPNFSFDLCRLACSIYDYAVTDEDNLTPVGALIRDWCLDDKGLNMLYKANGVERYPEFKLYKMIARCVHHHTPQAQLERTEFAKYKTSAQQIKHMEEVINIDNIPSFHI